MKKVIAIVLLLTVLSCGGFCMISADALRERANVTVKENVLYGDRSYAEGATVFTRAEYDYHLFWDTKYKVGKIPTCETEYSFSAKKQYRDSERRQYGVILELDIKYGVNLAIPAEEQSGISKAFRELYDETKPGEEKKRMIRLQDYYEYYPIRVSFDLPGTLWQGNSYEGLSPDSQKNEMEVWERFNEFFRIPVPKDLPAFEISVSRSERGDSIGIGTGIIGREFYLRGTNVYTSDRCFFSIGNRLGYLEGYEEEFVDTSLIPGGYGIYSVSYRNVRDETNTNGNLTSWHQNYDTGIDADSLTMVFPLEQSVEVNQIMVNPDETKLLLLTRERDELYFTVIDIASMKELQKFKVCDDKYYVVNENDDFIAIEGDENISVIALQPNGEYELSFSVPINEEINVNSVHKGISTVMDFDGERLVTVDPIYERQYSGFETCSFSMAVYTKDGLMYYAEYDSSLSVIADTGNYNYNILPLEFRVELE
ncbi:MAG: hypothetical protein E7634_08755 [Ruminococcaceae bacterium]|nr:hypothetical protein [Oscillospiraceae bacterium]